MMTTEPFIHFAYKFDGKGGATVIEEADLSAENKAETLTWIHFNAEHPQTKTWLKTEVDYIDNLIIDALLAEETRPRMLELNGGLLIILKGMNFNVGANPEDMVSLRGWIDRHRIITAERHPVKAIRDIESSLHENKGPKTPADFITLLSFKLFERMDPVLISLDEAIDAMESDLMLNPTPEKRQAIVETRKQAILFKRYISPQRDVLAHLCVAQLTWLDTLHRRQLRETYDRSLLYIENLDAIRERAQIIKDELTNALSERLNKNMYVISVITSIFMPLGFLASLMGMNVGAVPLANHHEGFWIVTGALTLLAISQLVIFKKLKWF